VELVTEPKTTASAGPAGGTYGDEQPNAALLRPKSVTYHGCFMTTSKRGLIGSQSTVGVAKENSIGAPFTTHG